MKKIKILGAGISGLTAAINLAKAGYDVEVYEKNKDVGMRFNGDLEGLENWSEKKDVIEELKDFNIKINFDCDPVSSLKVSNGTEEKIIANEKPFFYLTKRGRFLGCLDAGLKKQAEKLGVKIFFKKTLPKEEVDVVATGSIIKESPAVDKGIVFRTKSEDAEVMLLNHEMAFKGYSYLFITKGYGCICSLVFDELQKIDECFEKTKNYFIGKYDLKIKYPKSVGGIGSFSLKHRLEEKYKHGMTLFVGEAAGLQDCLWGFGMRYAFESGYLAAQSVIIGKDYEKMAKKRFTNKLKASIVNRYIWEKLDKTNFSAVIKHAEACEKNLYPLYNYTLWQRLLYPRAHEYIQKKYPYLKV